MHFIGYFVVPQIVMSIVNLMNTMPQRLAYFSSWSEHHLQNFPQIVKWINEAANAGTSEIIDWIRDNILKDNFQNLANMVSAQISASCAAVQISSSEYSSQSIC